MTIILNNYLDHNWLNNRIILAAKSVDVGETNFQKLPDTTVFFPGDLMLFKSIDTVVDENKPYIFQMNFQIF